MNEYLPILNWVIPIFVFLVLIGYLSHLVYRENHSNARGGDANAPVGCGPLFIWPVVYVIFLILWMLFFHRLYS
jgi:hypothetical protein